MYKLVKIESEVKQELRQAFKETKKDLDPLMNHLRFKDITPRWWIKKQTKRFGCAGKCFEGTWRIFTKSPTGKKMKKWFTNLIILDRDYYRSNGLEELKLTFKHELLHLIAKDNHGNNFNYLVNACKTTRYCKPKIKLITKADEGEAKVQ